MITFCGLAFSSNPIFQLSLNVDEPATEGWVETLPLCHTTWVEFVWIPRCLKSDISICTVCSTNCLQFQPLHWCKAFASAIDLMYVSWRGDSSKYLGFDVFNLRWCSQSRLWFLNRFGGESLTIQRTLAFNRLLAHCRKLRSFHYFAGSASKATSLQSQQETNEMSVIFIN